MIDELIKKLELWSKEVEGRFFQVTYFPPNHDRGRYEVCVFLEEGHPRLKHEKDSWTKVERLALKNALELTLARVGVE